MLFLASFLFACGLGLLIGRDWRRLVHLDFDFSECFIGAFFIQGAMQSIPAIPDELVAFGHIFSYLLLFIPLAYNFQTTGIPIMATGVMANFLVIVVNGGQMPVDLRRYGIDPASTPIGNDPLHVLAHADTLLILLSDRWLVPLPTGATTFISLGDVLMIVGLFLAVFYALQQPR